MNVGRLDRKIVIEQRSTSSENAIGESVYTWATFHTAFAAMQRVGGTEVEEADKTTATRKVKFKIRYFAGLDETMRVLYDGSYYDITEIQDLGREGLWLYANKKL